MKAEREIQRRISQKQQEIQELRMGLERAQAYVDALQESLKLFQRSASDDGNTTLRPNSQIDKARQVLLEASKPLHVSEILKRMGKEVTKNNRISLSGSIGLYVRRREVFTRPAPNTFGLIEFEEVTDVTQTELPDGFGKTM